MKELKKKEQRRKLLQRLICSSNENERKQKELNCFFDCRRAFLLIIVVHTKNPKPLSFAEESYQLRKKKKILWNVDSQRYCFISWFEEDIFPLRVCSRVLLKEKKHIALFLFFFSSPLLSRRVLSILWFFLFFVQICSPTKNEPTVNLHCILCDCTRTQ